MNIKYKKKKPIPRHIIKMLRTDNKKENLKNSRKKHYKLQVNRNKDENDSRVVVRNTSEKIVQ